MIGHLRGELLAASGQAVLVEAAGVGYEVEVPIPALAQLARIGDKVALHTHFIVRDDAQQLYGFLTKGERDLFRALLRISRIGPKLALSVISSVNIGELAHAAAHNDVARLIKVPGIGRKTAQRLLLELKDRLADLDVPTPGEPPPTASAAAAEAKRALIALGLKAGEAAQAIDKIDSAGLSAEELLRRALQSLANREHRP